MTENIIESTFDEGKKRIFESPFWSSFIISWLVINWKVLYITTSLNSTTINDKIEQIVKLYPAGNFSDFTHPLISLVVYPLLASFFAVTIIPVINHFYLWIRKLYHDWDATIEDAEINIRKNIIKKEIELQKEEKQLIKEKKGVLEEKKEVITLENEVKKSIYDKIITNDDLKRLFINLLQFIDVNNFKKDTINEALGVDAETYDLFRQFYSNDIIDYKIHFPLGHHESKYFLFFTEMGKKIALQMVKDGYIRQEDLIGKI